MSKERFTQRQAEIRNANARLQEAVAQPETPILHDAVIQRFEFTFELTSDAPVGLRPCSYPEANDV